MLLSSPRARTVRTLRCSQSERLLVLQEGLGWRDVGGGVEVPPGVGVRKVGVEAVAELELAPAQVVVLALAMPRLLARRIRRRR